MKKDKIIKLCHLFYKMAQEQPSDVEEKDSDYKNYPRDYSPGKKYGREVLAGIFSRLTGFPYLACRELFFPLLPGGIENEMDPGSMQIYGPEPITMEEFAKREMGKWSGWEEGIFPLSWDILSDETLNFIEQKRSAGGYEKRIAFQKNKILKSGGDSLAITPADEPIAMEEAGGKYSIREGWHRSLAILEMLQQGLLPGRSAPVRAVIGHRAT